MNNEHQKPDVFSLLGQRIPETLISTRTQGGAQIRYIEWHTAADLLDERAPGWTSEIREVGAVAGKIFVRVAMTIDGVTRENIGYEDEKSSGYGDPFSNAYAMAFKRTAALFGLGRHLYDKDDRQQARRPTQQAPRNAPAVQARPLRDVKAADECAATGEKDAPPTPQQVGTIKRLLLEQKKPLIDFSKLTYAAAVRMIEELQG